MNLKALKILGRKVEIRLRKWRYSPAKFLADEVCKQHRHITKLGTPYGGWSYVQDDSLRRSWVVLCGAGTDVSFDLALQAKYDCNIIIVDPTPRAVEHFDLMKSSVVTGDKVAIGDSSGDFYDIDCVDFSKIHFIANAVWTENAVVRFWIPFDESHVSHSITNYQKTSQYIEVEAITLNDIISRCGLSEREIALVKLDIEGAEIRVIEWMCENRFFPKQILVEFDELNFPNKHTVTRVRRAIGQLERAGYRLAHFDGRSNCSFVREANSLAKFAIAELPAAAQDSAHEHP